MTAPLPRWIRSIATTLVVGVVVFAMAPFPGAGMVFVVRDHLRGHPEGRHGVQSSRFVGLWIRDERIPYDFIGGAFYLDSRGNLLGPQGMTTYTWHDQGDRLFVDYRSHCGNCYSGIHTLEFGYAFDRPDRLTIRPRTGDSARGVGGHYRRVEITDRLKVELERKSRARDYPDNSTEESALRAIKQFEFFATKMKAAQTPG